MGTFSLVAFYTANALANLQAKYIPPLNFNATANSLARVNNKTYIDTTHFLSDLNVEAKVIAATAITFWVGIIHILMFTGQLGFITQYFSEPFIKSFTCAYSIHIFTSQLKNLFGLPMTSYNGIFKVPKVSLNFI
jgi:MFS superfamily sulfate permease-like transporter